MEATLSFNDSGAFIDKWVELKVHKSISAQEHKCVWTKGLSKNIYLPIAHGEGKFIPRDKEVLAQLRKSRQIVFRYVKNPNGSIDDIAGICDPSGRVLGMMPHPERHVLGTQHPQWTRLGLKRFGDGLAIFKNGVDYIRKYFEKE
jgi:phosphoribosylformylglycinamidine synthase